MDLKKTITSSKTEFSVSPIMKSRKSLSCENSLCFKGLDWVDPRVNLLVIWEKTETCLIIFF